MTCIAIRGRIIAADSRFTIDDSTPVKCEKLFRVKDGILGLAGASAPGFQLLHHLRKNHCLDPLAGIGDYHRDKFGALLLTRHGIFLYDNSLSPDKITEKFYAIGTGAGAALGAMEHGATVQEAVEAACKWDINCGGPVRWMKL